MYYIPNGPSDWMYTDPDGFYSTLTECNVNNASKIKPVVRLLKHWNIQKNYRNMASFSLEKKIAEEWYEKLKFRAEGITSKITSLSGGNQQKVVLGKWLLAKPEILFVDEPTKGIDVGAKAEIYKLMNELAQSGMSIVMVSSDMPELVSMSDRCVVLSNGRMTGEFTGSEITQENVMRAAIAQ